MAKRKSSKSPKTDLRTFRSGIAALKRAGLIPGRGVDARTARPNQKRGGKNLDYYVKKFKDVATGNAGVVELPKEAVAEQRKMGRHTTGKKLPNGKMRVIVPKHPDEKLVIDKKTGYVNKVDKSGVTVVELPGRFIDKRYKKQLQEIGAKIPGKKYWGYEFYGHKAGQHYDSLERMLADLNRRYQSRIRERTLTSDNFYKNITITTHNDWSKLVKEER